MLAVLAARLRRWEMQCAALTLRMDLTVSLVVPLVLFTEY